MTPHTERHCVGDLGNAGIGVPNYVVSLPVLAERPAAFLAPAASHDIQVFSL